MEIKIGGAWNPMTQMTPEMREEMDRREPGFLANYGKPDTRPRPRTFEERRAQIDETKRQIGNLNDVIAKGSGAIGAVWESSPLECDCQPSHETASGIPSRDHGRTKKVWSGIRTATGKTTRFPASSAIACAMRATSTTWKTHHRRRSHDAPDYIGLVGGHRAAIACLAANPVAVGRTRRVVSPATLSLPFRELGMI
jgi:hypothetical protein